MAWTVRVAAPHQARRGDIVEIRTLIQHPMETGFRRDHLGELVPRDIISRFTCSFRGEEVFSAELFPAIAANPYIAFNLVVDGSCELVLRWSDDQGAGREERIRIEAV
jgi:sulfur-oxidizing protein SoxZ